MTGLYTLSRGVVVFLAFAVLLGVLWFADSLGAASIVAGALTGFCSIAAAFVPQRKLSSDPTRRILITLCIVGTSSELILIADDLGTSRGIEWDVVALRFLHIAALATMALTALRWSPEPTSCEERTQPAVRRSLMRADELHLRGDVAWSLPPTNGPLGKFAVNCLGRPDSSCAEPCKRAAAVGRPGSPTRAMAVDRAWQSGDNLLECSHAQDHPS